MNEKEIQKWILGYCWKKFRLPVAANGGGQRRWMEISGCSTWIDLKKVGGDSTRRR